ncbi:hypothetical protein CEXT_725991 [Caerostris extrusa]|uniref:Uncharacterized protein n=1 Tax=Caerostris extrusa TaxID=172846 RepID=A0AAV4M4M5_CAEEX|nr:hypothetical protein CEXT_725991 [Caerostris extrusa]
MPTTVISLCSDEAIILFRGARMIDEGGAAPETGVGLQGFNSSTHQPPPNESFVPIHRTLSASSYTSIHPEC